MNTLAGGRLKDAKFESVPLRNLINLLSEQLCIYYRLKEAHSPSDQEQANLAAIRQELENGIGGSSNSISS